MLLLLDCYASPLPPPSTLAYLQLGGCGLYSAASVGIVWAVPLFQGPPRGPACTDPVESLSRDSSFVN